MYINYLSFLFFLTHLTNKLLISILYVYPSFYDKSTIYRHDSIYCYISKNVALDSYMLSFHLVVNNDNFDWLNK